MARHRSQQRSSSIITILGAIIGIVAIVIGGLAFYLVSTDKIRDYLPYLEGILPQEMIERYRAPQEQERLEVELSPRSLSAYSFDELAQIAAMMYQAPDEDAARAIAQRYNLLTSDGKLSSEVVLAQLDDGTVIEVKLAGLFHDDKSDGSGKAAISFIAGVIGQRQMNAEPVAKGGWAESGMRAWVKTELFDLLPASISDHLVFVDKRTNNLGGLSMDELYGNNLESIVTTTSDALWLFSAHEVCGDSPWFVGEYRSGYFESDRFEEILNAEGTQYQVFADAGVTMEYDPQGALVFYDKGVRSGWWYRSPHPFSTHDAREKDSFYQVMSTGYPYTLAPADSNSGVLVGFCF